MTSSSSSAQNLDLAALGDALGASTDDKKSKGGEGDSPATLSPNSVASHSPQPPKAEAVAATAPAAPAAPTTPASQPAVPSKATPPAATTNEEDAELQAKVRAVKGMFPHLDSDTVAAVLAAENGDEEAAVNVLLSMTPGNDSAPAPPPRDSHLSSDEALARSLALEEDEAYARATQAREDQRGYAGRRNQQQPPIPPRQSGGRGGGGAASFFNELKQSVQPLFDGKGPLARDGQRQQYEGAGGLGSSSGPSYDPSQLTYQPRVRKTPAARAGGAPAVQQQQQQPSQNASWSRYQPPTSATSTPQNTQQQQQQQWRGGAAPVQSQGPHQPIRLFGTPQTPTAPPRDTGKGREVLTGAGAGAAAGGAAVGAATGAAAGAASSSAAAPPASIASILEQGRRDATSPNSNGEDDDDADADDVDSDDLEYQKSPFDDED